MNRPFLTIRIHSIFDAYAILPDTVSPEFFGVRFENRLRVPRSYWDRVSVQFHFISYFFLTQKTAVLLSLDSGFYFHQSHSGWIS